MIISHKMHPDKKLYCLVTKNTINKNKEELLNHYNGRTFCKKMYETWKKKMFKARRKLYFKLSLIKKKSNQKKIKPKHIYGKSEI
jgi:hypothetical protein